MAAAQTQLTTAEEIEALPDGSILVDSDGATWIRRGDNEGFDQIPLPATLIRCPSPQPPTTEGSGA